MIGPSSYSAFQGMSASEKEGLVVLECAQRLMGWTLDSGSVFKLTGFTIAVFSPTNPVQDSGVPLTEAASRAAMTAGTYFLDRVAQVLYLRTSDSVNPNGKFIGLTFRMFFSRGGRNLPHDLASGFPVHWEGQFDGGSSDSNFSVELDNTNQLGTALEGAGTLSLYNDLAFWAPRFDKFTFENQLVLIYSWNPQLPVSQAQIIYRGRIQSKAWAPDKIQFQLKDVLNELTAPVSLPLMSAVPLAKLPDSLKNAFQRRLYGYVIGHRPTNVDQVLSGYPFISLMTATNGSATVTGTGLSFLGMLSPNDQIYIGTDTAAVTIKSIESSTSLTLTQVYPNATQTGVTALVKPARPNRYMNRLHVIAGHALREPTTTVVSSRSPNVFIATDTRDLLAGDDLIVNGELSQVLRISNSTVFLTTNLSGNPAPGASVKRPAIQNVRIDQAKLLVTRDYTYDPGGGTITLDPLAEFNVAPILATTGDVAFTSGSRAVVGTATLFTKEFQSGDWICGFNQSTFYEVLAVTDDTHLTLRTVSGYTITVSGAGTAPATRKLPAVFEEGKSVLSMDALGSTDDGTTAGTFLKSGPQIVQDLLTLSGTTIPVNGASFADSIDLAPYRLGLVIPKAFGDTKAPSYRDTINEVNQSIFGSLFQDSSFTLNYQILSPKKPAALARFVEADILSFSITTDSQRIVGSAQVTYLFKEYDPVSAAAVNSAATAISKNAQYLSKVTKVYTQATLLIDQVAAQIFASRWAFVFEVGSSVITLQTKMQGATLEINDSVSIKHAKLFQRLGSTEPRKIAMVHKTTKSVVDAQVDLEDLANAFSRCAVITPSGANAYANATADERLVNGYVTDSYGMQSNDPNTFGTNLIW